MELDFHRGGTDPGLFFGLFWNDEVLRLGDPDREDYQIISRQGARLSLSRLMEVRMGSPELSDSRRVQSLSHAWVLVHFLLNNKRLNAQFEKLVNAQAEGIPAATAV